MAISIAGFKSDRAHLGRNWPKGKKPCTAQHTGLSLERFVVEEWNCVAQLTLRNYVAFLRSRCQAVVNANGGHTRF